jgi:molecular chaperone DnaK
MVKDAQAHSEDDKKKRELVELRNQADSAGYRIEKLIKDNGEKVPEADKKRLEEAVAELRKTAEKDDAQAIQQGIQRLEELSHKVAETLLQRAARADRAAPQGGEPGAVERPSRAKRWRGDVVDAEYTVKN